jgi:hypothetical protein
LVDFAWFEALPEFPGTSLPATVKDSRIAAPNTGTALAMKAKSTLRKGFPHMGGPHSSAIAMAARFD